MAENGYRGVHAGLLVDRFGRQGGEALYAFPVCALALEVSGLAAYALKDHVMVFGVIDEFDPGEVERGTDGDVDAAVLAARGGGPSVITKVVEAHSERAKPS